MSDNFLQPPDDTSVPVVDPSENMPGLAGSIRRKFDDSENGRYAYEQRWLKAFKNFRGIYDSTTQYRETERSKVFIKITKTKVLAAYGQIIDILFANKKFPLVIEPTPVPEGIAEFAHLKTPLDEIIDPYGYAGDGRELKPGATEATPNGDFLGGLKNRYAGAPLAEGPSLAGEPQISPAQKAALNMEKQIHDQLLDTSAANVFRSALFEAALLGTGIAKVPFNFYTRVNRRARDVHGDRVYTLYE